MSPKPVQTDKLKAIGIEAICARIARAEFCSTIAKDVGVSDATLSLWLNSDDNIKMYVRAREAQADKFAEDIIQIADDGANDSYKDDEGKSITNQDVIARSRLRVDARKWLASKMAPKKYGEKLEIAGDPANPLKVLAATMSDADLARIASGQQ
jgi:hypothetical protein